jgi:hypothetical protein
MTSCTDFLDKPASEDITEIEAYADLINARRVLNNVYNEAATALYNPVSRRFGYELATDDAIQGYAPLWGVKYKQASVTADTNQGDDDMGEGTPPATRLWRLTYRKIRKANIFIGKIMSVPGDEELKKRFLAEARFLRAFFYTHLIRDYGGVIILDRVLDDYQEATQMERSTFKESVEWVVNELDEIALDIPRSEDMPPAEFGRITRGGVYACKARLMLYAASPLFNTASPALPEYTEIQYYGNYDKERWKAAADAAQQVLNDKYYALYRGTYNAETGGYSSDYTQVFMDNFYNYNPEYVWGFHPVYNQGFNDAGHNRSASGWNWINPTLELAESFEMTNGKLPGEQESGYVFEKPGENRDPRFKASIQFPGAVYQTYELKPWMGGSASHLESQRSGMCRQKWMDGTAHPNMSQHPTGGMVRPLLPYYRLAEILLNQAEALNEYYDTPNQTVYDNINRIRARVNMPPLPNGLTKEQMRERIVRERRVELAFEDHRFFDLLRWKTAEIYLNQQLHGYDVTKAENDGFYTRIEIDTKPTFLRRMYLSPLSTFDLLLNTNLQQNPGY